ncbi:sodium:calcium antiporter [Candidatus Micrarchaeota archaeon]|nr:sodium:calcium antiporter [Candidatus Micrarchaeota archaeon]
MIDQLLILILSVLVLAKAAEWMIQSALRLAAFFHLSEIAVGFLLLSVATSLPELSIALTSAFSDEVAITVGNVLGANIADVALVLGITALVGTVTIRRQDVNDIIILLIIISLLPLFMLTGFLSAFYGLILIGIFLLYAYMTLQKRSPSSSRHHVDARSAVFSAFLFSLGLAIVVVSAQFVVRSAVLLAGMLSISKSVIGATVIAWGTTVPELAVNLQAIRTHHSSLALGNILGSALTNLTLILGLAALINPLAVQLTPFFSLIVFAFAINALLLYFVRRHVTIQRKHALMLLVAYGLFLLVETFLEFPSLFGMPFG